MASKDYWVRMRMCLFQHPKVLRMVAKFREGDPFCGVNSQVATAAVVGSLLYIWGTVRDNLTGEEGDFYPNASPRTIDLLTGIADFSAAMLDVGWLRNSDDPARPGVFFPNYTEWNVVAPRATSKKPIIKRGEREGWGERDIGREGRGVREGGVPPPSPPPPPSLPQDQRLENSNSPPAPPRENIEPGEESPGPLLLRAGKPAREPLLVFPCNGKETTWNLYPDKLAEWADTFPGLAENVLSECKKALQWVRDNPTRRKTARGMTTYLYRWLERANNQLSSGAGKVFPAPVTDKVARAQEAARNVEEINRMLEARRKAPGLSANGRSAPQTGNESS